MNNPEIEVRKRFEEEVSRRVRQLPVVKQSGTDYFFNVDWEEFVNSSFIAAIGVYVSYKEKSRAAVGLFVTPDSISQFKIQHRFIVNHSKQTVVRTTEVSTLYNPLVDHLVDACDSAIKSMIHYFKTGEQLSNNLS